MIIRIPKTTYYHKWFIGATLVVPVLPLTAQTSPNLVFIMADQYRGDALGCLGKEPVKTPCLDHLASEGVLFTNAVSSYPVSRSHKSPSPNHPAHRSDSNQSDHTLHHKYNCYNRAPMKHWQSLQTKIPHPTSWQ